MRTQFINEKKEVEHTTYSNCQKDFYIQYLKLKNRKVRMRTTKDNPIY